MKARIKVADGLLRNNVLKPFCAWTEKFAFGRRLAM